MQYAGEQTATLPVLVWFLRGGRAWEAFVGCLPPDGARTTAQGAGGANALSAVVKIGEFERAEAG